MKIVITYKTRDGVINNWVCVEERFDHIMKVCEEKGFDVVSVEYLI
jgi:hypothetical protein